MTEEPERIWIDDERPIGGELHVFTDPPAIGAEEFVVEYIRADLAEAIVRAALESAAGWAAFTHGWGNAEDTIRRLAADPANVASIIKKAGEDRG